MEAGDRKIDTSARSHGLSYYSSDKSLSVYSMFDQKLSEYAFSEVESSFFIVHTDGTSLYHSLYDEVGDDVSKFVANRLSTLLDLPLDDQLVEYFTNGYFFVLMRGKLSLNSKDVSNIVYNCFNDYTLYGTIPIAIVDVFIINFTFEDIVPGLYNLMLEAERIKHLSGTFDFDNVAFCRVMECGEIQSTYKCDHDVLSEIIHALRYDTFKLFYQPVVSSNNLDNIVFYEGLLRLKDREGNEIPIRQIIHVAGQLKLVHYLDLKAQEEACKMLRKHENLSLSINVSPQTLFNKQRLESFLSALDKQSDVADRLIIEITEYSNMGDLVFARSCLEKIRERGSRIALDDFGVGYTSFGHLRALKLDIVKVDGSYIHGIAGNTDNQVFLKSLVMIAKHLNIECVVEYIENEDDFIFLQDNMPEIELYQGYYFSAPVPEPLL